ncbi:MAG: hypothetical protein AAFY36_03000 [Bacteroidota bacterium]
MQILTVVVGIIFVLLLLSLLATTLMELISSFFSLRGRNLIKGLRNMLASDDENETLLLAFQQNSLYRHLTQQYGRQTSGPPSYISAETFQSILFDVILGNADYSELEAKIEQLPDDDLKNVLQQLWRESGGQVDMFRLEVQNWYNNVMDRASGWFKRNTQKILVYMGLGIAVLFNADTIAMYERLSIDEDLRNELYQTAVSLVNEEEMINQRQTNTSSTYSSPSNGYTPGIGQAADGSTYTPGGIGQSADGAEDEGYFYYSSPDSNVSPERLSVTDLRRMILEDAGVLDNGEVLTEEELEARRAATVQQLNLIRDELELISSPLGLGWEGIDVRSMSIMELITKLLGFILTALAISLGAPFWFDLLRKIVNIRGAGGKPS